MTGAERITHVCSPEKHCDTCDAEHVLRQLSYMMGLLERRMHTAFKTHALALRNSKYCGCEGCR